jgi:hypothetical protein
LQSIGRWACRGAKYEAGVVIDSFIGRAPVSKQCYCNIRISDDPDLFETLIAYSKVTCSSV